MAVPTAAPRSIFVALVTGLQELVTDEHSGSSQQVQVLFLLPQTTSQPKRGQPPAAT